MEPTIIYKQRVAGLSRGDLIDFVARACRAVRLRGTVSVMITTNREIMGDKVNGRAMNILGWTTTVTIFAATLALVITWIV